MKDRPGHRGDLLYLCPFDSRHGVEVDAQFVGMLEVLGAYGVRVQLKAGKIGEPGEGRRITRNDLVGRAARREAQFDYLDPGGPALGRPFLIEVIATDAVRVAHEHVGTAAGATQRPFGHRKVIADQVELGVLRLGEQHLVGVRDGNFATGDYENFRFALSGQGRDPGKYG